MNLKVSKWVGTGSFKHQDIIDDFTTIETEETAHQVAEANRVALYNDLQNKVATNYYKGVKGDTGIQGLQGTKGDTGDQGIQGVKGDKGDQGIQGVKGDKGDQGIQGIQGLAGTGDMLKSTYDTNSDGIVNHADLADAVPWGGITSKPTISGTNTGDETTSTIKTKLSITTLSGNNTGDQDLSGLVAKTVTVNNHALSANVTVTASDVGLGNINNTSDASKPISTATQTALDLKAALASPTFTGTPKSVTPATADSSTNIATTAYVKAQPFVRNDTATIQTLSGSLSTMLGENKSFNFQSLGFYTDRGMANYVGNWNSNGYWGIGSYSGSTTNSSIKVGQVDVTGTVTEWKSTQPSNMTLYVGDNKVLTNKDIAMPIKIITQAAYDALGSGTSTDNTLYIIGG